MNKNSLWLNASHKQIETIYLCVTSRKALWTGREKDYFSFRKELIQNFLIQEGKGSCLTFTRQKILPLRRI